MPSPGRSDHFINRSILYKDQYDYYYRLGWFQHGKVNLTKTPIEPILGWRWNHISRPLLELVEAHPQPCEAITSKFSTPSLAALHKKLAGKLTGGIVHDVLNKIHASWCAEPRDADYAESAIATAGRWLQEHCTGEELVDDTRRSLFELEAAATFLTHQPADNTILFSGIFASNWILAHQRQLSSLIQTELCETPRVFNELLRLGEERFAPVVVNEYNTVSDGNHRLTSAWIWNLLQWCKDIVWSLDCEQFQARIEQAVVQLRLKDRPVTLHETLQHLSNLLAAPQQAREFESKFRPLLHQRRAIEMIPVVFVPEYLCCAVDKPGFEAGRLVRAEPRLYRAISENGNLTLPPRAHYHYTDSILLPWFRVV
ncbi:MAG: hypothetical protein K2W95_24750 [Candidatus Obscuribacterales bacterium]|nr:hypothetical protein [Candidatus Obscuribacterales bacterium]